MRGQIPVMKPMLVQKPIWDRDQHPRGLEARNQVIHSYWTDYEPGDSAMRIKRTARQKGLRVAEEVMSPAALYKISNEISDVEERVRTATLL